MIKIIKKIDKFLETHDKELRGLTLGLSIAVICKGITKAIENR